MPRLEQAFAEGGIEPPPSAKETDKLPLLHSAKNVSAEALTKERICYGHICPFCKFERAVNGEGFEPPSLSMNRP